MITVRSMEGSLKYGFMRFPRLSVLHLKPELKVGLQESKLKRV